MGWWGVKWRGAKATCKTHLWSFLLWSIAFIHGVSQSLKIRLPPLWCGTNDFRFYDMLLIFDALLKHQIGNPTQAKQAANAALTCSIFFFVRCLCIKNGSIPLHSIAVPMPMSLRTFFMLHFFKNLGERHCIMRHSFIAIDLSISGVLHHIHVCLSTVAIFCLCFSRYFTMPQVHYRKPYDFVLVENCRSYSSARIQ